VNVLLDTHVLIWWDEGRRLAAEARQAIEEAVTESGFLELPVTARHTPSGSPGCRRTTAIRSTGCWWPQRRLRRP
jgi:hypothetical protein